ncbi:MAG: type II toxin-antitoxin system Phd/YefM family antitoxin [Candidatus Limnocylindria bacterium]
MQPAVTTRELRRDILELAERVAAGEAIVVTRHGTAVALLRKALPSEDLRRMPIERFRRNIAKSLRQAEQRPQLITWHGRDSLVLTSLAVVLSPVPPALRDELEEAV